MLFTNTEFKVVLDLRPFSYPRPTLIFLQFVSMLIRFSNLAAVNRFADTEASLISIVSGTHEMEPASPIQAHGDNPFPSRFINREVSRADSGKSQ